MFTVTTGIRTFFFASADETGSALILLADGSSSLTFTFVFLWSYPCFRAHMVATKGVDFDFTTAGFAFSVFVAVFKIDFVTVGVSENGEGLDLEFVAFFTVDSLSAAGLLFLTSVSSFGLGFGLPAFAAAGFFFVAAGFLATAGARPCLPFFFDAAVPEPSLWFTVAGSFGLVLLAWLVLRRFGPLSRGGSRRHAADHSVLPTVNAA